MNGDFIEIIPRIAGKAQDKIKLDKNVLKPLILDDILSMNFVKAKKKRLYYFENEEIEEQYRKCLK